MPVQTLRPDTSISLGKWTLVGPPGTTLASALNDDNDATYITCTTIAQIDSELAKVGLADINLPVGSKIFSVGVRARVQQVPETQPPGPGPKPPPKRPRCLIFFIQAILIDVITRNYKKLFRDLFHFECPRPKPPDNPGGGNPPPAPIEWETIELAHFLQQPAGGEWTQESFNDFFVAIGRDDAQDPVKFGELYVDVDYNTAPVGTPYAPTGAIDDTTRPTVRWTYADQESDRQQAFIVRVFNEAQYTDPEFDPMNSICVAESGWTKGEDLEWTVDGVDLVNGNYRAYLQVEQVWGGIGSHRSVVQYTSWTQNVPGPPDPHLAAVFDAELNRVRLDLTEGGPVPETISYNVEYSDDAGLTWGPVRDGTQISVDPDDRSALIYDYEAPLKALRKYRAQAFRQLLGLKLASGYSNEVSVVPDSDRFWLKDLLIPDRNMTVTIEYDDFSITRDQGVFRPITASDVEGRHIVVNGPSWGREGELTIVFTERDMADGWPKFQELYRGGNTLLYQLWNGEQYYIAFGDEISTDRWLISDDGYRIRRVKVKYYEVKRPDVIKPGKFLPPPKV